jgi:Helix-turn-helix domain
VRELVKTGKFPPSVGQIGKAFVFHPRDLERFLKQRAAARRSR